MSLDLSKASGPDCIPAVVLKNCEPELSFTLAELFNKFLNESCFPDCWNVSSVVPVQGLIQKEKVHIDYEKYAQINILASKIATR